MSSFLRELLPTHQSAVLAAAPSGGAAGPYERPVAVPERNGSPSEARVALVCSPGGHLQQMLALRPAWEGAERFWVTLDGPDVDHLLAAERVIRAHGPTNRSVASLLRNLLLAWRLLGRERPDAVLSTGAGVSVPFLLVARLRRCRTVYVESLTRTESLSLSGRMVYPFVGEFFVQWPTTTRLRRARHVGSVL